jgi:hypothetical protein
MELHGVRLKTFRYLGSSVEQIEHKQTAFTVNFQLRIRE